MAILCIILIALDITIHRSFVEIYRTLEYDT